MFKLSNEAHKNAFSMAAQHVERQAPQLAAALRNKRTPNPAQLSKIAVIISHLPQVQNLKL